MNKDQILELLKTPDDWHKIQNFILEESEILTNKSKALSDASIAELNVTIEKLTDKLTTDLTKQKIEFDEFLLVKTNDLDESVRSKSSRIDALSVEAGTAKAAYDALFNFCDDLVTKAEELLTSNKSTEEKLTQLTDITKLARTPAVDRRIQELEIAKVKAEEELSKLKESKLVTNP